MGSFGPQNSCHPVWQSVVEHVDEVVGDGMESHLAGIPKFFGLVLQASSFILPQICSIIFISGDCAGHPLKYLFFLKYLFPPEKLHRGMVWYGKELHPVEKSEPSCSWERTGMQESVDIWHYQCYHPPSDLPGTSVLDVTPNHNLSTSKFDCLLGEPWVQVGP